MKRICLALDLKNNPDLIREYQEFHQPDKVWPEITKSILDSGIQQMEIYRVSNRLFMIIEAGDDFSLELKSKMDNENTDVQKWERLMWSYQQALPTALPGEKWMVMEKIFNVNISKH